MTSIDQIITSICWTLFHSLWQGGILLVIGSVLFHAIRNTKATVRYRVLLFFLAIFILTVVVTFYYEWNGFSQSHHIKGGVSGNYLTSEQFSLSYNHIQNILTNFISNNAWWIVIIWGILFVYHMIVLYFNYKGIQKMRYEQVYPVSAIWLQKLENLKELLHMRMTIYIQESAQVSVPIVMGILQPLILVPVGMLNSLRADEVEAILLHELAHVKRYDFLVNLIQKILQAIFFFNPGYIWLSKMLKIEREYCCDEIAVSVTGERKSYVKALVAFHDYQQKVQLGQAFASEREVLLGRAKKLVTGYRSTISKQERKVAAATFLVLCCISYLLISLKAPSAILINGSLKDNYLALNEQVLHPQKTTGKVKNERNTISQKRPNGNSVSKPRQQKNDNTDTIGSNDFLTINTKVIETPSTNLKEMSGLKKNGTSIKVILSASGIKELVVNGSIVEEGAYSRYKEDIHVLQKRAEQPIPVLPLQLSDEAHNKAVVIPKVKNTSIQVKLAILAAEIQQLEEDQKALDKTSASEEKKRQIFLRRQIVESERRMLLMETGD